MSGFRILCEMSKGTFAISHNMLNLYTAKCAFYWLLFLYVASDIFQLWRHKPQWFPGHDDVMMCTHLLHFWPLCGEYNRLSIYRGYIWYDNAYSTSITLVQLRSDLYSRTTPHTSPLMGDQGGYEITEGISKSDFYNENYHPFITSRNLTHKIMETQDVCSVLKALYQDYSLWRLKLIILG